MYAKVEAPAGAASKGDYIEFEVEGIKYKGFVIGVYANSVSVEAEDGEVIKRKKETYLRTVVRHDKYKILPPK